MARHFAERRWVRRRCQDAEARIVDRLGRLDRSQALPAQVLAWLFPTGVTTHVLLTAGLRNPTIRLRYLAVGTLLADYGRAGLIEELLALLGCGHLTGQRVERHLAAMTAVFDAAAAVARTPFPFASDISAAARPIAVDGGRDLIAHGHHREAVFWIVATYARCLTILASDAPPAARAGHEPGFAALLADLGVADPAALGRRARETLGFLPGSGRSPRRSWPPTPASRTERPAGAQQAGRRGVPTAARVNSRRSESLRGIRTATPLLGVHPAGRNRYWPPDCSTSFRPS